MNEAVISCIQLNSSSDIDANLKMAGDLIKKAALEGADFILTPENTDFIGRDSAETLQKIPTVDQHIGIPFFAELAKKFSVWLLIGSMKVKLEDGSFVNRSFLFCKTGQLAATYDKIHMFDVDIPNGESHRESDIFRAGKNAVLVNTPWKKLGLSICYDLRFAYLYRELAQNGAEMIAVPAAFTQKTGEAHWEVLLRARAIETGSFILAPAQVGDHPGGRKTYGHSMIIDPWGKILAQSTQLEPDIITRKVNFTDVFEARKAIPALQHDREFALHQTNKAD